MESETRKHKNFIGYEYKEIEADPGQVSFLIDGYENFGWEIDENVMQGGLDNYPGKNSPGKKKAVIRLKRDRKIINKMELTRLQRNFEACVDQIRYLEKEKTARPTIMAVTAGGLGTAFMAGSTFAVTADPPQIALCIILAVPGFPGRKGSPFFDAAWHASGSVWIFLVVLPEFQRGILHPFLKQVTEMAGVLIPDFPRDRYKGIRGVDQHPLCLIQPPVNHVVDW